jgi:hypothetical protein
MGPVAVTMAVQVVFFFLFRFLEKQNEKLKGIVQAPTPYVQALV